MSGWVNKCANAAPVGHRAKPFIDAEMKRLLASLRGDCGGDWGKVDWASMDTSWAGEMFARIDREDEVYNSLQRGRNDAQARVDASANASRVIHELSGGGGSSTGNTTIRAAQTPIGPPSSVNRGSSSGQNAQHASGSASASGSSAGLESREALSHRLRKSLKNAARTREDNITKVRVGLSQI
jgi:hypothetical protein|tara:strand:- start:2261 stop:2809 length:549 start_codon:yes stop_codon:yes gene_type:complete